MDGTIFLSVFTVASAWVLAIVLGVILGVIITAAIVTLPDWISEWKYRRKKAKELAEAPHEG